MSTKVRDELNGTGNLQEHVPDVGNGTPWVQLGTPDSATGFGNITLNGLGAASYQNANRVAYERSETMKNGYSELGGVEWADGTFKCGIGVRKQSDGSRYSCGGQDGGSTTIYRNNAGTWTPLVTNGLGYPNRSTALRVEVSGDNPVVITMKAGSTTLCTFNDTSPNRITTAGKIQFEIEGSSTAISYYELEDTDGAGSAPSITAQPSNQSVVTPATATFSITATGATGYQWQRSTNGGSSFSDISGATSSSYTTPPTAVNGGSANNGDQYRCIASNGTGPTTSSAATLTVTSGNSVPVFSAHPANQSVAVGATPTLTATSTGSPTPTSQWQRSTDGGTVWFDIPGATSSSYTLPAVALKGGNAAAGDRFRRKDTNVAGSQVSNAASLTVIGGAASMTSQGFGRNNGAASGASSLVWAKVVNITTGEDVTPILTGLTVNSSSQVTLAGLPAGTYVVFWREAGDRYGWGLGVAA
ncbi:hypothetical protein [Roseateles sp.]|uniref:hypothetical protein n=1 Tax=Roseateles sp. TaxID=1971397 RepID=UPI002F410684